MIFPYSVDVPMQRLPIANWVLMAITIIVSLIMLRHQAQRKPADIIDQLDDATIAEFERLEQLPAKEAEREQIKLMARFFAMPGSLNPRAFNPLQLVTYQLLHGDIWHLLGNMLFLFCFGNAVNARLGHIWFVGLYFVIGILAGLAWLIMGSGVPLVGASGSIMGMLGIFLVFYPENEVDVFYMLFYTLGSFSVPSIMVIFAYLGLDLLGVLFSHNDIGGVAYICHLVGAFFGMLTGVLLLKTGVMDIGRGERNILQMLGYQDDWEDRPIKKKKLNKKRMSVDVDSTDNLNQHH